MQAPTHQGSELFIQKEASMTRDDFTDLLIKKFDRFTFQAFDQKGKLVGEC